MYGGAAAAVRQPKLQNTPYQVGLNRKKIHNFLKKIISNYWHSNRLEFWFSYSLVK